MKIYTKRGDQGETDLLGGMRVSKDHPQVRAYGAIDHACSMIGLAASAQDFPFELKEPITAIMAHLFAAGAEVATAPKEKAQIILEKRLKNRIDRHLITLLEEWIDGLEEKLSPLRSFILPAGCDSAARLHCARTAVRFAEQELIALHRIESQRPEIIMYFNRLSDLLFVMARFCNKHNKCEDVLWHGQL